MTGWSNLNTERARRRPWGGQLRRGVALWFATVWLATAAAAHAQQDAYVANLGANTVSVIDTETSAVVATIPVGDNPDGVAATPDGRLVYVANFLSDDVSVIDTSAAAVIATVS